MHVNSEKTNNYWIENYNCIRKLYKDEYIIVVDDNSNEAYLTSIELYNCIIIKSEFISCGELLAYYYFYTVGYKYFNKAIIIHDSVFVQKIINIEEDIDILFIWNFEHKWDRDKQVISLINNSELYNKDLIINLYLQKKLWNGCFGVQSIISYEFLCKIHEKYNLLSLVRNINNRENRCNMERLFAVICTLEKKEISSLLGDIHNYNWGYNYSDYLKYKNRSINGEKIMIKCWTGR